MQEVLYRFFDSQGTLLYVGISKEWVSRIKTHEKYADFYSAVAGMTLERFPDRKSVEDAERAAIKSENPLFNRMDNPNYRTWQTHFRELLDMATGRRKVDGTHEVVMRNLLRGSGDDPNFGTGLWLSRFYPPEWWESTNRGWLDCDLCDELAQHATVHQWGFQEEEE